MFNLTTLSPKLEKWKRQGNKIVFTNGVFDILHQGHVTYLKEARKLGDKLIVGINSDASVKRLGKGDGRPINPEYARAFIISELKSVDAAVIFSQDTPLDLITAIQPDYLVKGGDYDPDCTDSKDKTYIVGSKEVKSHEGKVVTIDLVEGFSTTKIIKRINKKS